MMNFLSQYQKEIKRTNAAREGQVIAPKKKEYNHPKEGIHKGIISEANFFENVPSKYGLAEVIETITKVFEETELDVPAVHEIKQRYYISEAEHSRFVRDIGELLGFDPRHKEFSTTNLVGIPVEVEIEYNFHNGRTYANISSLRKINLDLDQ